VSKEIRPPVNVAYVPVTLLIFGLISIGAAIWFLMNRARQPHHRYVGAGSMTTFPDIRRNALTERRYQFLGLPATALALPVLALIGMMVLRTLAFAGLLHDAPATFAIVTLALTWWLGVFGWLSMAEIVSERPWVVFIILVMGIFGVLGLTDNHTVPTLAESAATASSVPWLLLATWVLAVVSAPVRPPRYPTCLPRKDVTKTRPR
jgi:hypothetical protein